MNTSKELIGGSRAAAPDLDWSQVRETVLMLELSAAQIESAMRDSNSSVDVLSESFMAMAGYVHAMSASLASLPDTGEVGATKESLTGMAEQVSGMVNHTIIAFQFYDKLVQRLDHVCHSLSELSDLVSSTERLYNPQQWSALQERIRSKYTMAEERGMFDAVMAGATVQDALKNYMTERMQKVEESSGEIELF